MGGGQGTPNIFSGEELKAEALAPPSPSIFGLANSKGLDSSGPSFPAPAPPLPPATLILGSGSPAPPVLVLHLSRILS